MSTTYFDRGATAHWHAEQHLKTDPGIRSIYYLPTGAPEREIRLIEVNELIAARNDDALEPIDFGVEFGSETEHQLLVLDVTPSQWDRISESALPLPPGWSLDGAVLYGRK